MVPKNELSLFKAPFIPLHRAPKRQSPPPSTTTNMEQASEQLVSKIFAIKEVNDAVIARVDHRSSGQVSHREYAISNTPPFKVDVREWNMLGSDLIFTWRNKGRSLKQTELQLFQLEIDWAANAYTDLVRLNLEIPVAVSKLLEWVSPTKLPSLMRVLLDNMELVQVMLGEIEALVQDTPDALDEISKQVDVMNEKLVALRVEAQQHSNQRPVCDLALNPSSLKGRVVISQQNKTAANQDATPCSISCTQAVPNKPSVWKVEAKGIHRASAFLCIGVHSSPANATERSYNDNQFFGCSVSSTSGTAFLYKGCDDTRVETNASGFEDGAEFTVRVDTTATPPKLSVHSPKWKTPLEVELPYKRTWYPHFCFSGTEIKLPL